MQYELLSAACYCILYYCELMSCCMLLYIHCTTVQHELMSC